MILSEYVIIHLKIIVVGKFITFPCIVRAIERKQKALGFKFY